MMERKGLTQHEWKTLGDILIQANAQQLHHIYMLIEAEEQRRGLRPEQTITTC